MHLTLIKPNIGRMEHSLYVDEGRMQPLQLGVLAGACPEWVDVALLDDRCETIPYDTPTDLVAITVETYTARRAYEMAAEYRQRGVRVVMGGFHPTLIESEVAEHADCVVTGDAEPIWETLLCDARDGKLQARYAAPRIGLEPQARVLPRRDLFARKGYLPMALVQFGRGCKYGCTFCAISSYFKKKHWVRDVQEVVREIEAQDERFVFFVDDNIVADFEAAKALFRAITPLKIRWVSQGTINMVHERELMDLMLESGCLGHVIGFESIEAPSLKAMKKAPALLQGYERFDSYAAELEIIREYGLQTWAAFTLGHDDDTPESLYRMLEFARSYKFCFAAWNILMPYPGTPLYTRLEAEDRLLYDGKWWLHPEYRFNHAAFRPTHMSPDELTDICFDIRSRWNSLSSLAHRLCDPRTHLRSLARMGVFLRYNRIFRKEVFKKQGMLFGLFR
jgi:radical SAM superfamily enzyme YgiQ (UPF0313 family)